MWADVSLFSSISVWMQDEGLGGTVVTVDEGLCMDGEEECLEVWLARR